MNKAIQTLSIRNILMHSRMRNENGLYFVNLKKEWDFGFEGPREYNQNEDDGQ